MEQYNFWQDFFDTYQSLSDWIKALWLLVPPGFVLALIALLVMRPRAGNRPGNKRFELIPNGELIYSVHRDAKDRLHVIGYLPSHRYQPDLILLERPLNDPEIKGGDYRA
jgi:hypothetical protein